MGWGIKPLSTSGGLNIILKEIKRVIVKKTYIFVSAISLVEESLC